MEYYAQINNIGLRVQLNWLKETDCTDCIAQTRANLLAKMSRNSMSQQNNLHQGGKRLSIG